MGKSSEQRLILAVGAVLIAIASLVGVVAVSRLTGYVLPAPTLPQPGTGWNINSDETRSYLALLLYFVVAATWVYLVWDATNSTWRRGWLYGVAVLFFGSFSVANYLGGDSLIPVQWQAMINVPFAFVSIVCFAMMWSVNFTILEAKILKFGTLFTLATFGVILPTVFDLFYVAVRLGIVDKDKIYTLALSSFVYIVSAAAGIVVSALNYIVMQKIKASVDTPSG